MALSLEKESVGCMAGDVFVYLKSDGDWTLSISPARDWASLNKTSGKGPSTAILHYEANGTDTPRSLTLRLVSGKHAMERQLVQEAYSAAGPVPEGINPDPVANWLELPAVNDGDGRYFFTHDMTIGGRKTRNYSFYLDTDARIAAWVAYPLNRGLIGSGSRSDAWGLDPKVPKAYQSVIYSAYRGGYERGHQLPSADRYSANVSTFYGTNMTPQKGSLNENAWASLETMVRTWSYQFDTLYVVTGADIAGSSSYATDNEGKKIAVPTGYFKALLGYKRSATIGMTPTTGGYTAIGFYFKHQSYDSGRIMEQSMTIDALEEKLGTDFFVNLPGVITPKLAAKVESTMDPWWK